MSACAFRRSISTFGLWVIVRTKSNDHSIHSFNPSFERRLIIQASFFWNFLKYHMTSFLHYFRNFATYLPDEAATVWSLAWRMERLGRRGGIIINHETVIYSWRITIVIAQAGRLPPTAINLNPCGSARPRSNLLESYGRWLSVVSPAINNFPDNWVPHNSHYYECPSSTY